MKRLRFVALGCACATALVLSPARAATPVAFDDFVYRGDDAAFAQPLEPGQYRNPVLAGFYPDPAVTRVGDRYYLVNSTFAYFPGIPVFESEDLVHWKLLGHAIDRPGQLDFSGLGTSRAVFAPSISHHGDTFYIFNTAVDNGGNYYVTASNPAGPWSDPVWLKGVDGIDPSLFIDADGQAYLLNNGPPEGMPRYEGHRAIWLQAFDLKTGQPFGPRKVLLDGGVEPAKNPIWIEGPHIYRHDGWYYLSCAEGGTGPQHSQVVLRARSPWGPFKPYEHNPILTQRELPADRADPIANAGHADLVEGLDGRWWAIFLASRIYGKGHYNTGRETFLLPVDWRDGWPVILDPGKAIPQRAAGPSWMRGVASQAPRSGNFEWRDDFGASTLKPEWLSLRAAPGWADLKSRQGRLLIEPQADGLDSHGKPSFLGRRQQHLKFDGQVRLAVPDAPGVTAGLAMYQDEQHWYVLGVRRTAQGATVFVQRHVGTDTRIVAQVRVKATDTLRLRIGGDAGRGTFAFDAGQGWQTLRADEDIHVLSTDLAGGFVGVTLGPYARAEAAPFQED